VQGLPLPNHVLAPMPKLTIKNNGSAFSYAQRIAAGYGFARPTMPGPHAPELFMDLGELTADEMMNLFAEFSAWANYAAVKVAEAEAAEDDVESDLKVAEARFIITKMTTDEEKITTARLQRDSDPEVIRLQKELRRRRAVRKLLATYFSNYERSAAVLSRELTRRGTLFPYEHRSGK
jgi:hypothetical protein